MQTPSRVAILSGLAVACVALYSISAPALKSSVKARAAVSPISNLAARQLRSQDPAQLAKYGKIVNQLVGPNASPKDFKKLANEVACASAIKNKNTFLKNAACANVEWYGPNRQIFLPGKYDQVPAHLKGELPGDFGFDPFGLGSTELAERAEQELIHGRWAMLGAAGILAVDVLDKAGVGVDGKWWKIGAELLAGKPIDYLGNPNFVHASNFAAIFVIQFFLMASAEVSRAYERSEATTTGMYPGGNFDPLGFGKNPEKLKELKVKEIKNGRLAMLAVLGFGHQAFVTGKSPLDNLADHIANPFVNHY
eukprot:CAMPEP_0167751720 /NCGR_PEP_ID=MMETSP0110_2-20121227/6739_1 /TAXON_ID=629695 /ORGANISM="Gymnochlora sp., Strain CCMP2014" /LENGTH=308 /DNA_ID=CAMNT_0007637255 /DNA_START=59 /DNA_END=985 /DNA_ORIENTATION=-